MDNDLAQSLRTHLFIEFFNRLEKRFLNEHFSPLTEAKLYEQYGVPNGCQEACREIIAKLKRGMDTIEVNNDWILTVKVFFNRNPHVSASFMPVSSRIMYNTTQQGTKYYYNPLMLTINPQNNERRIFIDLMHELTHAYEDYNRQVNGRENIIDNGIKYGYQKNVPQTDDDNEQILSRILYYTYNVERNAFVSSMVGELKSCDRYFAGIDEVLEYIYNTETYKLYDLVMKWIDGFCRITDTEIQDEALEYVHRLSNLKFRTYRQFTKYLQRKKQQIKRKFETIIPKIAYEHLNLGGMMGQNKEMGDNLRLRTEK